MLTYWLIWLIVQVPVKSILKCGSYLHTCKCETLHSNGQQYHSVHTMQLILITGGLLNTRKTSIVCLPKARQNVVSDWVQVSGGFIILI